MTELAFVLERSGSMNGLKADIIGGFNSVIKKVSETVRRVRSGEGMPCCMGNDSRRKEKRR